MAEPPVARDRLPAPNTSVEVAVFPGALVVFDVRNRMAHELVGAPAVVFDACGERLDVATVFDELVAAGVGDRAEVAALVDSILADLAELGLLEGCDAPSPPPCAGCTAEPERRWWRRGR